MNNTPFRKNVATISFTITLLLFVIALSVPHADELSQTAFAPATDGGTAHRPYTHLPHANALKLALADVQDKPGTEDQPKNGSSPSKAPDEVQALKEKIIELQNKGKLGFRKIVACRSVEGFGSYSPIERGQTVDRVSFYCEPSNVSTMRSGDRYIIDCSVDFFLTDSTGRLLVGKKNALKLNRVTRSPVFDLYFKIDMHLKKYLDRTIFLKTVLNDRIKNQTISVTTRINVEGKAKKKLNEI